MPYGGASTEKSQFLRRKSAYFVENMKKVCEKCIFSQNNVSNLMIGAYIN